MTFAIATSFDLQFKYSYAQMFKSFYCIYISFYLISCSFAHVWLCSSTHLGRKADTGKLTHIFFSPHNHYRYIFSSLHSPSQQKRNCMDPLEIGIIAFIAWFAYSRYETLSGLVFTPGGAKFDFSNPTSPVITINILVQNPTSNSLTLNSIAANVTLNGNAAGNISDFTQIVVAPNSQSTIPLSFRPNLVNLISQIYQSFTNGEAINGTLVGTANVNNTAVPINMAFSGVQNLIPI